MTIMVRTIMATKNTIRRRNTCQGHCFLLANVSLSTFARVRRLITERALKIPTSAATGTIHHKC